MDSLLPRLNYYRPSGIFPPAGIATLFGGCAGGAALGAVYAFANYHIPLVYLNVLLLLGFAASLSWLGSWGVRKFHVRNAYAAAVMGAGIFLAAYTVHWTFYIATVVVDWTTDSPYDAAAIFNLAVDFMRNPTESWELIEILNETGVWNISSAPGRSSQSGLEVKGIELTVIWIAEALVLLYFAVRKPWEEACKPYSERQGEWMKSTDLPAFIPFIENSEEFKHAVNRGDYSALITPLPASEEPLLKYAKIRLYSDALDPYITVQNVSISKKKKKETVSEKNVVRCLKISPITAADISSALAESPETGPYAPSQPQSWWKRILSP
jgi:hypothetical protein